MFTQMQRISNIRKEQNGFLAEHKKQIKKNKNEYYDNKHGGIFLIYCYIQYLFLSRDLSQLCAGGFNRGSGWVLLPKRLPGGSNDEAAGPSLPAVWLWWLH